MSWLLIVISVTVGAYQQFDSVGTFATKEICEAAVTEIRKTAGKIDLAKVKFVCVSRG